MKDAGARAVVVGSGSKQSYHRAGLDVEHIMRMGELGYGPGVCFRIA